MATLSNDFKEEYDSTRTCSKLGMRGDPETRYAYSSRGHVCFGVNPPEAIILDYQERFCLGPDHVQCVVNRDDWKGSLPRGVSVEKNPNTYRIWRYILTALFVTSLIIVLWLFVGSDNLSLFQRITPISFDDISSIVENNRQENSERSPIESEGLGVELRGTPSPPPGTPSQLTATPTLHLTWTQQPTLTSTPPPTPGPGLGTPFGTENVYVLYRVQEGQSLLSLAELYDTSQEAIQAANALREGRTVWPGDIIVIPVGQTDPGQVLRFTYQFIEKKTNIIELADETGASLDDLRNFNLLGDNEWIPAGRWLIIPDLDD